MKRKARRLRLIQCEAEPHRCAVKYGHAHEVGTGYVICTETQGVSDAGRWTFYYKRPRPTRSQAAKPRRGGK